MVTVIIMRGLPGSGKDRYFRYVIRRKPIKSPVNMLATTYVVVSNDSFFTDGDKYDFNKDELHLARLSCFGQFKYELESSVEKGIDKTIVVLNNNVFAWEMAPYIALAELHGIKARIIALYKRPFEGYSIRKKGTPNIEIVKMWDQFEWNIPWDQEVVGE